MLSSRALLNAKEVAKAAASTPVLSPVVVRSLYRRLFREVSKLDASPMGKTLFFLTPELQAVVGTQRPLYVPGSKNYLKVLRKVFRDPNRTANAKLAFDTLNRLRVHNTVVQARIPPVNKERAALVRSLAAEAPKHVELFRAEAVPARCERGPRYVSSTPNVPSKMELRGRTRVELEPGTVLLAHPLSSTHVNRRVMIITERTPVMTSGVVLDLQFVFPISRGNPMFPEVFWGHELYDGGFDQISLTMPPTAQVVVLHTLEPPTEREEAEVHAVAGPAPATALDYVSSWIKYGSAAAGSAAATKAGAADSVKTGGKLKRRKRGVSLQREHELLCQPIIKGATLSNGEKEPTLYLSKGEALPYLSKLAAGQPRSSLRVYWGSMRWMTSHIETEVGNGHFFPVKVSPSFFRPYDLAPDENLKTALRKRSGAAATSGSAAAIEEPHFPTLEDLAAAKELRTKRLGADVSSPQLFPAEGAIRRRECLWDEILYALGGEYTALVGGVNPFMVADYKRTAAQILAPLLPSTSPLGVDAVSSAAVSEAAEATPALLMDEDDDITEELLYSSDRTSAEPAAEDKEAAPAGDSGGALAPEGDAKPATPEHDPSNTQKPE